MKSNEFKGLTDKNTWVFFFTRDEIEAAKGKRHSVYMRNDRIDRERKSVCGWVGV